MGTFEVQLFMRVIETPLPKAIQPETLPEQAASARHTSLIVAAIVTPLVLAGLAFYLQNR
jgi:hypothetical protein